MTFATSNAVDIAVSLHSWSSFFSAELWSAEVEQYAGPFITPDERAELLADCPAWVTPDLLDGFSKDDMPECWFDFDSLLSAAWGSENPALITAADKCDGLQMRYMASAH